MSDKDRKLPFFFSVAFILCALTIILFASSILTSIVYEENVLLPYASWQQGVLILLFIFIGLLLFFIAVFFTLASFCGIVELRFQFRKLKHTQVAPSVSRHPVNQHTSPYQQRRSHH